MQDTMPENWLLFIAEHTASDGERQAIAASLIAVSAAPADAGAAALANGLTSYGRYWAHSPASTACISDAVITSRCSGA